MISTSGDTTEAAASTCTHMTVVLPRSVSTSLKSRGITSRLRFKGGDGIITVTASDATRVETWGRGKAVAAVRTFVEYFDTEIDKRYYTIE